MIRWLLWLLGGLLLGGIVHLATVLLLPRTATQDAYTRLAATAPANSIVPLPAPTPDDAVLPFMDPAFATAVCRYDLGDRPAQAARAGQPGLHVGVVLYAHGVAYYAINDRAAGRRTIELDLMTSAQRAELPEDEEVTAADRLIVESPTPTGLILVRTFGPGARPDADGAARACVRAVPPAILTLFRDERRGRHGFGRAANSAPAQWARAGSACATIAPKRVSARSASTARADGTAMTRRSSA